MPYFKTKINNESAYDMSNGNIVIPKNILERQALLDAKLQHDYSEDSDEPMKLKVFDTDDRRCCSWNWIC
jgi:hypothetical protein